MVEGWPFGPLRMLGYDLIVADPPWDFRLYSEAGEAKSAHAHYDCMTPEEIKALPVGLLAGRDCLLALWTTGWAMATGLATDVVRAWGFAPVTEIVWRKTTRTGKVRMGPGYRARTMHEPVLIAKIGNPVHGALPSLFDGVAREHSRKPDEFYDLIRSKTKHMLHRVDLFSREMRPGFEGWGREHGKFDTPSTGGTSSHDRHLIPDQGRERRNKSPDSGHVDDRQEAGPDADDHRGHL